MNSQNHPYEVRLSDADLDALRWQWRKDCQQTNIPPSFEQWLSGLLWEQAHAIRAGLGAHQAWIATQKKEHERAESQRGVHFHLFPERK